MLSTESPVSMVTELQQLLAPECMPHAGSPSKYSGSIVLPHLQPDRPPSDPLARGLNSEAGEGRARLRSWDGSPVLTETCGDFEDPGARQALAFLAGSGEGARPSHPQRLGRGTSAAFQGAPGCASVKDIPRKGGLREVSAPLKD